MLILVFFQLLTWLIDFAIELDALVVLDSTLLSDTSFNILLFSVLPLYRFVVWGV